MSIYRYIGKMATYTHGIFYYQRLFNPSWISSYIHIKQCDVIANPRPTVKAV